MDITSLKFKSALCVIKTEQSTGDLPKDVIDYCNEVDFSERIALINQVRPPVFKGGKFINTFQVDEGTCGDECVIETGSCFHNTLIEPVVDPINKIYNNFFFRDIGWISDIRLVISNEYKTDFVDISKIGIEEISILVQKNSELYWNRINTVCENYLEPLQKIYGLQPEQVPILLKRNQNDTVMFPVCVPGSRFLFIKLKTPIPNLKVLVTHSFHYNHKIEQIQFGYIPEPGEEGLHEIDEVDLPLTTPMPYEADFMTITKHGSTLGVSFLIIKTEDYPKDNRIKVKDLNMDGEPFWFPVPDSRKKIIGDYTIVSVDNLTFEVLLDDVGYVYPNTFEFFEGKAKTKYQL